MSETPLSSPQFQEEARQTYRSTGEHYQAAHEAAPLQVQPEHELHQQGAERIASAAQVAAEQAMESEAHHAVMQPEQPVTPELYAHPKDLERSIATYSANLSLYRNNAMRVDQKLAA